MAGLIRKDLLSKDQAAGAREVPTRLHLPGQPAPNKADALRAFRHAARLNDGQRA